MVFGAPGSVTLYGACLFTGGALSSICGFVRIPRHLSWGIEPDPQLLAGCLHLISRTGSRFSSLLPASSSRCPDSTVGRGGQWWFPHLLPSSMRVYLCRGLSATMTYRPTFVQTRVLKNDFVRYNLVVTGDDGDNFDEDDNGWKVIQTDVFRFPPAKSLFCAILGESALSPVATGVL